MSDVARSAQMIFDAESQMNFIYSLTFPKLFAQNGMWAHGTLHVSV